MRSLGQIVRPAVGAALLALGSLVTPVQAQPVQPPVKVQAIPAVPTPASSAALAHLDASTAGNQPWMTDLDTLLKNGNFADARRLLFRPDIAPLAAAERLRPWAEDNNTPAMWLLAERLWYAKRAQDSANWVYAAVLGTRMDASVCMDNTAIGLETNIVHAFFDTVQAARRDPEIMRNAIVFALDFHQRHLTHPGDPRWVCSMAARPENAHLPIVVSESQWNRRRSYQLDAFRAASSR